jgi:hypothetical protein
MAQYGFRMMRRFFPEDRVDNYWRALEGQRDVGFRLFRIEPLKTMTWRGDAYPARYRNVYTD